MDIAICGDISVSMQLKNSLPKNRFNIVSFVDFTGNFQEIRRAVDIPVIDFIKFKSMFKKGEIDGILVTTHATCD